MARLSSNRSTNRPTDRFERSRLALGVLYCECFVMADSKRANTERRLRNTDRIVVMEDGRIMDVGDHSSLVSRSGLYRQLYELQSGGLKASRERSSRASLNASEGNPP